MLEEVSDAPSQKLVSEVYTIMSRDDVTECAKGDPLIVSLGNNWLKRNMGNKLKRKYYSSSRMRGAARLLQHLRTITNTNMTMSKFICPMYFDKMCEAALLCASMENDDEEDLKSPSSTLEIGFDIKRMKNLKLGLALKSDDKDQKREAEEFTTLLKMEWSISVSRMAHLKLREDRMNRPHKPLPIPQDLSILGGRVSSELKEMGMNVKKTFENYKRAVMLLETRLLTYNKRRSGELEALSLENYKSRSQGLDEADRALMGEDLTDLEKYLVTSQELIQIRGKIGKIVPILVPEDAKTLMADDVRRAVGVKPWNNYVFANTGDGVIRAYDSLKSICGELSLSAPEQITSVTMRKYIATLSQVIDMKDFELEWLCNLFGHTASIHKLHYRSTSGFIERVDIGKLMLLVCQVVSCHAEESDQHVESPENVPENEEVDLEEDEVPRKKPCTRQAWTEEEETEIKELLHSNFQTKTFPKMKECMGAISKSRRKGGVVWKRKWETIKKKVIRMMKKNPHLKP
ncbi:uncharacterized protein [Argopecten irradians]|uniref:uncharacterized protein n=1 Tax=Argopecten irradians TaxID=31199 RepID=UPI00371FC91C